MAQNGIGSEGSENSNCVAGHPDVQLLESLFEAAFQLDEERFHPGSLFGVDVDSDEVIPENPAPALPSPLNYLSFTTDRTKLAFEFLESLSEKIRWCRPSVIKPQRQQYLVAAPVLHT